MKYTSTDIFAAIGEVMQKHQAYGAREDERDVAGEEYNMVCYAVGDLQSVVDVVYKQENFNPEIQDAYDIANFILEWVEEKYEFGVWEPIKGGGPSLKHTRAYTADAIRFFLGRDKDEIKLALRRVTKLASCLSEGSWEYIQIGEPNASPGDVTDMVNIAEFVSSTIAERMQKEELESITDEAA